MDNRHERAAEAIRHGAAEFLAREAGPQSLITVTGVVLSTDLGHARVLLSVLPEDREAAALGLAHRHVEDFKDFLRSRVKLPRMPRVDFEIDRGEKNRQRLEEIS